MRNYPDKIFEVLLALDKEGVIIFDEDEDCFEIVDEKAGMATVLHRFAVEGVKLFDETRRGAN